MLCIYVKKISRSKSFMLVTFQWIIFFNFVFALCIHKNIYFNFCEYSMINKRRAWFSCILIIAIKQTFQRIYVKYNLCIKYSHHRFDSRFCTKLNFFFMINLFYFWNIRASKWLDNKFVWLLIFIFVDCCFERPHVKTIILFSNLLDDVFIKYICLITIVLFFPVQL
jgi:hypothetical protein